MLIAKQGEVVNSSTHLRHVLGGQVADFVEENRKTLKLQPDEMHMLLLDIAPCHVGDFCKETGEKQLQLKRRSWYTEAKFVNHFYARNGSPELCVNDQIHKLFLACLHTAVDELVGRGKLLHERPASPDEVQKGGPFYTEAGIRRGATPWHYALACSIG